MATWEEWSSQVSAKLAQLETEQANLRQTLNEVLDAQRKIAEELRGLTGGAVEPKVDKKSGFRFAQ